MVTLSLEEARAPKKEVSWDPVGKILHRRHRGLKQESVGVLEKPFRSPERDGPLVSERGVWHQGDSGRAVS